MCPRLHGSGPAGLSPCCFVKSGWRGWNPAPAPPSHPTIPDTLLPIVPSPQTPTSPRLLTVRPPVSWVRRFGWGRRGEEVCAGGIAAPPEGAAEAPRALLPRLPVLVCPPVVTTVPGLCPCGPQPDTPAAALTPASFPSGSEAPGVAVQTFPAPETSVSGSRRPLGGFHAERAGVGYFLDF